MISQRLIEECAWIGISPSNPLAFLASLGAFRLVATAKPDTAFRLKWADNQGVHAPLLTLGGKPVPKGEVLDLLGNALESAKSNPFLINLGKALESAKSKPFPNLDSISVTKSRFREWMLSIAADPNAQIPREFLDFAAGLSSDTAGGDEKLLETEFRISRSHEFMKFMRNLIDDTEPEHIEKSLYQTWANNDPIETHSMRWEPKEDAWSRYALRWDNPGDGNTERKKSGSEWGANRLAIEGLAWFPTMPRQSLPTTTAFIRNNDRKLYFSWPIWETPLSADCIRSLLARRELTETVIAPGFLNAMGINAVYRAERLVRGKYRNFSDGVPV